MKTRPIVLVADDDVADVALFQRAVAKACVRARFDYVQDGLEVLTYLQASAPMDRGLPDALLLDLKMPRMDGFEVLECLSHQPELRPQTVAVLSSSGDWEAIHRASQLNVDHYFVKPSSLEELVRMVKELDLYCPEPVAPPLLLPAAPMPMRIAAAA